MLLLDYFILILLFDASLLHGYNGVVLQDPYNNSAILTCDSDCVLPNSPENGDYILLGNNAPVVPGSVVENGTMLLYRCSDGYEPAFAPTAICQDGEWSTEFIQCRKTSNCLLPNFPTNGEYYVASSAGQPVPGAQIPEWTVLRFNCAPLHQLIGQNFIMCRKGAWSGIVPECKRSKQCPTPEPPVNGNYSFIGSEDVPVAGTIVDEHTVLYFNCNSSHFLNGGELALCLDGRWLGGLPTCEETKSCSLPEPPRNGKYAVSGSTISAIAATPGVDVYEFSILSFSCGDSFILEGTGVVFCQNKRWSSNFPLCKKNNSCVLLEAPKNGHYEIVGSSVQPTAGQSVNEFSAVAFSCDDRYTLIGPNAAFCKDERWSNDFPKCEHNKSCVVPNLTEHGNFSLSGSSVIPIPGSFLEENATLILTCSSPYELLGQRSINCVNSDWSAGVGQCIEIPGECSSLETNISGVYKIRPTESTSVSVYCDMELEQQQWTVIQSRFNGSVDFYRNFSEYQKGFGSPHGEYWLGLDHIYELTKDNNHELYVDLEGFNGTRKFARYSDFSIGNADAGYAIHVSGYSGTAGDSLLWHNGMKFSTFDKDQDGTSTNCATARKGAWWYNSCAMSNLNGHYYKTAIEGDTSFNWYYMFNKYVSIKSSRMLVRRK